jgi:chromosome segregation ATPase
MREVASPQQEEAIRWNSRPSGLKLETADDVAAFSGNDNADDNDSLGDLSQFDFKKRIDDAVVGSMDRQYTELRDRAEAAEFMQHGLAAEKGRVTDQLSSIRKENESLRAQLARVEDSRQKAEHDKLIALNEKEGVEKRMAAVSKREKQLTVDNDKLSSDMFQATQGGKSLQSVARALHNDIKIRDQVEASLNKKVVALEKELVTTRAEVAANGAKCNETETRRLETAQRLEAQENETAEAQREIEKLADELCKSVDENAKLKSQWETFAVAMGKRDESMNALWNAKEQAANKGLESENTSKNLESIVNTQMQEIATAAESVKQMQRDRDKSSATMLETKSQNEKLVKELELSQAMAKTFMAELDAAREKAHSMKMKVEKLEDVCNQKDALVDMQKQAASTFKSELDALQGPLSDTTLMDSTAVQIRELQATVSNVCNQKQELSLEIQAQKVALQEVEDELKRTKDENKRLTEEHIKIETKAYHLQNNLQRSEYRILKAQATIYDASLSSPKDENAGMQETVKGLLDSQTKLTKERNDAHIQILSNEIKSRHSKSNLMHKQQQLNAVTTQKKSALAMNRRLLNDIEGLHSATSIGDRTLDLSKVKLRNASQKVSDNCGSLLSTRTIYVTILRGTDSGLGTRKLVVGFTKRGCVPDAWDSW